LSKEIFRKGKAASSHQNTEKDNKKFNLRKNIIGTHAGNREITVS